MPAKIAVIYYTHYNHVLTLAESVAEGVKSALPDAQVDTYQIEEVVPEAALQAMHVPPKTDKYPVLKDMNKLKEYDGFLFGFPTRYGRTPAAVSALFDATGQLWQAGALTGKFAGIFTSTATQHGGQETTAFTTLPFLTHHGIIYVPLAYSSPKIMGMETIEGGSPWGASTVAAGDGSRQVSDLEKEVARDQGSGFAKVVGQYVDGKAKLAAGTPPTVSEPSHSAEASETAVESTDGSKKAKKRKSFLAGVKGTIKKLGRGGSSDDGKKEK